MLQHETLNFEGISSTWSHDNKCLNEMDPEVLLINSHLPLTKTQSIR